MHITSIPELIKKHGNAARVARETGWHEATVYRLRWDGDMKQHTVLNGVLMTARTTSACIPQDKW